MRLQRVLKVVPGWVRSTRKCENVVKGLASSQELLSSRTTGVYEFALLSHGGKREKWCFDMPN